MPFMEEIDINSIKVDDNKKINIELSTADEALIAELVEKINEYCPERIVKISSKYKKLVKVNIFKELFNNHKLNKSELEFISDKSADNIVDIVNELLGNKNIKEAENFINSLKINDMDKAILNLLSDEFLKKLGIERPKQEEPEKPVEPAVPEEPAEPSKPNEEPAEPDKPEVPEEPEKPAEPKEEEPVQPEPEKPVEPEYTPISEEAIDVIVKNIKELIDNGKTDEVNNYLDSIKLNDKDRAIVNERVDKFIKEYKPVEPEKPTEPEIEEPVQPEPEKPVEPEKPSEPEKPGEEPTEPDKPEVPNEDEKPVEPETPEESGKPADPKENEPDDTEILTPVDPNKPEEPKEKEFTELTTEVLNNIVDTVTLMITAGRNSTEINEYLDTVKLKEEDRKTVDNIIKKLVEELNKPEPEQPHEPEIEEPTKPEVPEEPEKPADPKEEEPVQPEPETPNDDEVTYKNRYKKFNNQEGVSFDKIREKFLKLINDERATKNLPPLEYNERLQKGTEQRSQELADFGSIRTGENKDQKHKRPNGEDSFRTAFDYLPNYKANFASYLGENLASIDLPELDNVELVKESANKELFNEETVAKIFFTMWKNSPGHYKNFMKENYKTMWLEIRISEEAYDKDYGNGNYSTRLVVGTQILSICDEEDFKRMEELEDRNNPKKSEDTNDKKEPTESEVTEESIAPKEEPAIQDDSEELEEVEPLKEVAEVEVTDKDSIIEEETNN